MAADGYWLKTPETHWRRVSAADYLDAMTRAGFLVSRNIPARAFKAADGTWGTMKDPNATPREIGRLEFAGRVLTVEETAEFARRMNAAFDILTTGARVFMQQLEQMAAPLAAALNELVKIGQELEATRCDPDPTPPTSGEPTPIPTGVGWPSKPASDAVPQTGDSSTS